MGVQLKIVAQTAMDNYYRDFKGNTGFFELNDFIFRAAAVVTEFYQKAYEQKYNELRQEKKSKDELVGVDPDLLSVQTLEVETKPGLEHFASLKFPVMSFIYDKSSVGYQFLQPVEPNRVTLERGSMDEKWEYPYLPTSNRILWWPENGKIKFYQTGSCNVKVVDLFYIPSVITCEGEILGDSIIADGLINTAVNATVAAMRQLVDQKVVKESLDGNNNPILETEINK